jgi:hypothetical protein
MRADLLALTEESLAALANRGIVRRATREISEGAGPALDVDPDDQVTARFPDGVVTTLPTGATLEAARCACRASGVCRHKVAAVLAYQHSQQPPTDAPAVEAWSPAEFTDEALEAVLGARVMAVARQSFRVGYRARVRRPNAGAPEPAVELGSCTVRFLVPHEIGYAHLDAVRGARDDAVALAVWAFRAADATNPTAGAVELDVGGSTAEVIVDSQIRSGVEPALELLDDLLADGASHTGASIAGALSRVRRDLERSNLRWPIDVVDAISDQLDAYRVRSARYGAERFAGLLAELAARHRCVAGRGASLRSQVLGTEEAAETALRRLRLTGIGCRIGGDTDSRSVRIYLVHGEAGAVLVLDKTWELAEGESPTGRDLGDRRLSGSTVGSLAGGNVVTESAMRSARRAVRIASNRVAKTTVARSAGGWSDLPDSILVRDLRVLATRLAGLPPRIIRPRVEADLVHVVEVGEVTSLSYAPGLQQLTAQITAVDGGEATVVATHRGVTPGALDALAAALRSQPRFISGIAYRFRGEVMIDPLAVVAGDSVIIPDIAAGEGTGDIGAMGEMERDALVRALDDAIEMSAEVAHRGFRHLPPTFSSRIDRTASALRVVGLRRAAESMALLGGVLRSGRLDSAASVWIGTQIRLMVTAESL